MISYDKNNRFELVVSNVRTTSQEVDCSGASVLIIHNDKVVTEEYWGKQSNKPNARPIQADTQFHVASVRKSYIGFVVAYAINEGFIESIDDDITNYLPSEQPTELIGTTIRHLITHTHGLKLVDGDVYREFAPGSNWAYRGIGVDMLTQIVKTTSGQSVAEIVMNKVLKPLQLKETGWYGELNEKLVEVIRKPDNPHWITSKSTTGDKMNMYVSTRDLAKWGYLHLKRGLVNGQQLLSEKIFDMTTTLQSPEELDTELPHNGFLWFVKDLSTRRSEIGDLVPKGSFQILGYTGVALLVIPKHNLVAVRAFNSFGSPEGFDYLADVRNFGDAIMTCLSNE
ncbi:serine hydrolase domain-containing protein [Bacillus sinesaloumensis]|uniref:serine hydrolase domain-containing protein n=1 Tax=Litchfieldia sinesaloumensis TaxID=1926280 RepID=UPI001F4712DE|nr:serine hydrolase domain-containing protein [Bacillus sinesaloumensis]